ARPPMRGRPAARSQRGRPLAGRVERRYSLSKRDERIGMGGNSASAHCASLSVFPTAASHVQPDRRGQPTGLHGPKGLDYIHRKGSRGNTGAMFRKLSTFEKGVRSDEADAWVPPRSLWRPLNVIRLIGIAVVTVVVAIVLTRAFYPS